MVGPSRFRLPGGKTFTDSIGNGPKRVNSDTRSHPPPNVGHPRGSVAYLDHIISHWDFGRGKYVRAWLNTRNYQRDRRPHPYFTEFRYFFDTPVQNSAAPHALGYHGFFRGSYSYHFHKFWWEVFDLACDVPDLGPRFKKIKAALSISYKPTYLHTSNLDSYMPRGAMALTRKLVLHQLHSVLPEVLW